MSRPRQPEEPTPHQQAILRNLLRGGGLARRTGQFPRAFMLNSDPRRGTTTETVRTGTVDALLEQGLIAVAHQRADFTDYGLTEAGRKAAQKGRAA